MGIAYQIIKKVVWIIYILGYKDTRYYVLMIFKLLFFLLQNLC